MTENEEFEFRLRLEREQAAANKPEDPAVAGAKNFSLSGKGAGAGGVEQFVGGAKHAFDRAALGTKGIFTDLTPEDTQLLEQGKQFVGQTGGASTAGEIFGDVALTAAPSARAGQIIGAGAKSLSLAKAALARGAGTIGTGAAVGAVTNPLDRASGAVMGGAGAGVGMGLQRAVGGLVKPLVSPEARALMDEGIQPTMGQSVGGMVNRMEQAATSLPLVGDAIRWARNRATGEFNDAVLGKIGGTPGKTGDEALGGLRRSIGKQFDDVLDGAPPLNIDHQAIMNFTVGEANDPTRMLSADSKKKLFDLVNDEAFSRGGPIPAAVAKRIESDLGRAAAKLTSGNATAEERSLGEAVQAVHSQWRDSLRSALPTDADRAALDTANANWRGFIPVDRAGASAGAQSQGGVFTPRQLRRSIEALDKSQFNNKSRELATRGATGSPYEQINTLGRKAEGVLDATVPDSGTAGRVGLGALALGVGGMPAVVAGAGAGGIYTRVGQRLLTEGVSPTKANQILQAAAARGIPPEVLSQMAPAVMSALLRQGE